MAQSYTWENGRQLKTLTNSKGTWTYTYDADGMRTGRTNGTTTYEYIYAGDKLVRMVKNGEVVDFGYAGNQLATMTYDGVTYYYVLNGQGDVVALTDSTGTMIIGYHYSAYGCPVLLKTDYNAYNDLKYLNPFLYRGYAYDIETTLYYLQSRYYDPEMGRFINADAYASTGQGILGNNMFAYCQNNPICFSDPSGYVRKHFPICLEFDDENNEETDQDQIYAGTLSAGCSGSVGVGPWIWGGQIFITLDANGYVALQWGIYSGMSAGPNSDKFSASITPFIMGTNAPGYMALEGPGIQMGGTIPPYSLDYVAIMDPSAENIVYHGFALGGFTTTPDMHITGGTTGTFFAVVFDWELYHQITSY